MEHPNKHLSYDSNQGAVCIKSDCLQATVYNAIYSFPGARDNRTCNRFEDIQQVNYRCIHIRTISMMSTSKYIEH